MDREAKVLINNKGGVSYARLGKEGTTETPLSKYLDAAISYHSHTDPSPVDGVSMNVHMSPSDESTRSYLYNQGWGGRHILGSNYGHIHIWGGGLNNMPSMIEGNFSKQFYGFNLSWIYSIIR